MLGLSPTELLIILAIVITIFGVSKLAGVGGALGTSIKEFRKAVRDEDAEQPVTRSEGSVETRVYDRDDTTDTKRV